SIHPPPPPPRLAATQEDCAGPVGLGRSLRRPHRGLGQTCALEASSPRMIWGGHVQSHSFIPKSLASFTSARASMSSADLIFFSTTSRRSPFGKSSEASLS